MALWPVTLPQFVQESGFSDQLPDQKIESQIDNGPPKTRRRFTKNFRQMSATIHCDAAQSAIFDDFYNNTLAGGVLPFIWVDPISQASAKFRFRKPAPTRTAFGSLNAAIAMNLYLLDYLEFAAFRFDSDQVRFDSTLITFDDATVA